MSQERVIKKEILRMVAGFRRFRERYFNDDSHIYGKLASVGQKPKTLMIACSDSRVDPAIVFSSSPGEIFVVRNVANLVPPFESSQGFHGVSAAIEFAVVNLEVENIVILGHRQCGGIRSLFHTADSRQAGFVAQWMTIATDARDKVLKKLPHADVDTLCRECERESITISMENLRTFPFIVEAIKARNLELFGVYFDIENGQLWNYDETRGVFDEFSIADSKNP